MRFIRKDIYNGVINVKKEYVREGTKSPFDILLKINI